MLCRRCRCCTSTGAINCQTGTASTRPGNGRLTPSSLPSLPRGRGGRPGNGALAPPGINEIVDLGCGTGAASAAWAAQFEKPLKSPRATATAGPSRRPVGPVTFSASVATVRRADLGEFRTRGRHSAVLAAWAQPMSKKKPAGRSCSGACCRPRSGARRSSSWSRSPSVSIPGSTSGSKLSEAAGGNAREWRLRLDLPPLLAELDRAAA